MKLKLDTINKTIEIEENVNLDELFKTLKVLLPNDTWKEYTLYMNATIYWTNPITIPIIYPEITQPVYPPYPNYPWLGYENGTGSNEFTNNLTIVDGLYCVEINN